MKPSDIAGKDSLFSEKMKTKMKEAQADLMRLFASVFDTENGKLVLEHLERYSKKNFPNYDNVNATFSKIGEQTLVDYIKGVLIKSKQKGE